METRLRHEQVSLGFDCHMLLWVFVALLRPRQHPLLEKELVRRSGWSKGELPDKSFQSFYHLIFFLCLQVQMARAKADPSVLLLMFHRSQPSLRARCEG